MDYSSYLKLETLLSAQKPVSTDKGRPAHDELLFITIHQAYELWFKQILFELDSILASFSQKKVADKEMGTALARLHRINEIMKVLIEQVKILETMTPMDFLEFRDLIYKASGFQSLQFRLLENKLGLRSDDRLNFNSLPYHTQLAAGEAQQAQAAESAPTLFSCLESWLSRTPFLDTPGFQFWEQYKVAANIMFQQDEGFIKNNSELNDAEKKRLFENIQVSRDGFASLFDEKKYEEMKTRGEWRLNYRAVHGALLIQLYREQPIFQLPFRLITEVLTLDSHLTQWRYRHALMVKRMLGSRIGTGGSSGAKYLRESTEQHKIFEDFYKLTTFFIPRTRLPDLPKEFEDKLGFAFETSK
ncbi:MAG: tryptophan 2,3-dioxygenase [Bdellovibrionales bacterium]|nr:tryptophan 2,3-dioxygenase [Bdellovibrionales bacterium]